MMSAILPKVMGVLNLTPDSFSDGGFYFPPEKAIDRAASLINQGTDIIDVGGESTRPGAPSVSEGEELARVLPVIEAISSRFNVDISIDSSKPAVMSAAIDAGAGMINDVYALRKEGALEVAAKSGVSVCLMHMQGEPRTMQETPQYGNLFDEMIAFFKERLVACEAAGIQKEKIILDPGVGFGKSHRHNLQLIANLDRFSVLGLPLLVGVSRKSMIGNILNLPVEARMIGSVTAAALAAWQGASILRVHDVRETVEAMAVCHALMTERNRC